MRGIVGSSATMVVEEQGDKSVFVKWRLFDKAEAEHGDDRRCNGFDALTGAPAAA